MLVRDKRVYHRPMQDYITTEVVRRNRIGEAEQGTESLTFGPHMTQPVLNYLKYKYY
jgi:hypothetical protein